MKGPETTINKHKVLLTEENKDQDVKRSQNSDLEIGTHNRGRSG